MKHATTIADAVILFENELKSRGVSRASRMAHSDLLLMQHFEDVLRVVIGPSLSPCNLDYFALNILQVWKPFIEKSLCLAMGGM